MRRADLATVDLLLKRARSAGAANRYGDHAVVSRRINGDAAMVTRLLEPAPIPNATLPDGETVLMTAARTGNVPVIKALLARGANVRARERRKGAGRADVGGRREQRGRRDRAHRSRRRS